ncbi:magnesium and cobalt transport protein CorA [Nocardia sp. 2]|uniref:Magnesium and cobalt transport protein CorA n=1 Tax=Nocardia acididurans TaxID=2802282 RepID=A0ABS1MB09_9NOCA|nr:magnesium and cobalt transport protein CorA [Nocardia acididurans]MBL1077220.1 magnesium and cobalt transport protein CorA [Nocardia acididurans]
MTDGERVFEEFTWIAAGEPSEIEVARIEGAVGLVATAFEDVLAEPYWPILTVSGEAVVLALRAGRYVLGGESVELTDVVLAVGPKFLVTICAADAPVRQALSDSVAEAGPHGGSLAAFHAATDAVIDSYLDVLENLDRDIKRVEREVFSRARGNPVERIYQLRRAIAELEQVVAPLGDEPLERLARRRIPAWMSEDAYGRWLGTAGLSEMDRHVRGMTVRVRGLRALLDSILSANLTRVGLQQNTDMRKISAWVAIAAIPTMIAGIYGMNFEHMPELSWNLGYPYALILIITLCGVLYWRLRRNDWL